MQRDSDPIDCHIYKAYNYGAAIGVVVAVVIFLALLIAGWIFWYRRRSRQVCRSCLRKSAAFSHVCFCCLPQVMLAEARKNSSSFAASIIVYHLLFCCSWSKYAEGCMKSCSIGGSGPCVCAMPTVCLEMPDTCTANPVVHAVLQGVYEPHHDIHMQPYPEGAAGHGLNDQGGYSSSLPAQQAPSTDRLHHGFSAAGELLHTCNHCAHMWIATWLCTQHCIGATGG